MKSKEFDGPPVIKEIIDGFAEKPESMSDEQLMGILITAYQYLSAISGNYGNQDEKNQYLEFLEKHPWIGGGNHATKLTPAQKMRVEIETRKQQCLLRLNY